MNSHIASAAFAAILATAAPASAATTALLTFDAVGLVDNYQEDGFTLKVRSGVLSSNPFGNPDGGIFTQSSSVFEFTGGYFTFNAFDGGTGDQTQQRQNFTVTGFLGNTQAFTSTFTRTGRVGFRTFTNPDAATVIDRLVFSISNTGLSAVVDNISLNYAASPVVPGVPEPGTWAMIILGMGATGFAMRRRQAMTNPGLAG